MSYKKTKASNDMYHLMPYEFIFLNIDYLINRYGGLNEVSAFLFALVTSNFFDFMDLALL